jgi:hypothetical protein
MERFTCHTRLRTDIQILFCAIWFLTKHLFAGCGHQSEGVCQDCTMCAEDEFEIAPCAGSSDRQCSTCMNAPSCGPDMHRASCGHGQGGECVACASCEAPDKYRVGCNGGLSEGQCVDCEGVCAHHDIFHMLESNSAKSHATDEMVPSKRCL